MEENGGNILEDFTSFETDPLYANIKPKAAAHPDTS